jgi:hypothetical protein
LQEHSVQIYRDKATKLDLPEASGLPGVFLWNLPSSRSLNERGTSRKGEQGL